MNDQAASWSVLGDGVDNGNHPLLLGNTYCADAVNVSMRTGFPCTRPGFTRQAFTLPVRNYQGAGFYASEAGPLLLVGRDGHVSRIHLETKVVADVTEGIGLNLVHADRFTFLQADRFFLIQDGRHLPLILDGLQFRRSDMTKASKLSLSSEPDEPAEYFKGEIPTSYFMAYGQGRIAMAQRGTNEILFGDILALGDPENILLFTENNYLNEGGSFKLPNHIGAITGMAFMPVAHSANGLGPLVVFGTGGAFAIDLSGPRALWSQSQIASAVYQGPGALGARLMVANSRDLYFVAEDGWRSIKQSVSNLASEALDYSMSREINGYTLGNEATWMSRGSMAYSGKRLFVTTCPTADGYFGGLAVADLDLQATARNSAKPSFNGIWTLPELIVDALAVTIAGATRLLVVTRKDDTLSFWVESPDATSDSGEAIASRVISRALMGPGPLIADRQFSGGKVFMENVQAPTTVQVSFRMDQKEAWTTPAQVLDVQSCFPGERVDEQTVTRRSLQIPVKDTHHTGSSAQIMVEWTGHACLVGGEANFAASDPSMQTNCGQIVRPDPLTTPTPSPYKLK